MKEMHEAIVTRIKNKRKIEGADRIVSAEVWTDVFLANVVVSIDTPDHALGVYFEPNLQVSEIYAEKNDLVARFDDEGKKIGGGYFDHRRKVEAKKFKGVRSEGLWMPIESLYFTGKTDFSVGQKFNVVNGFEICTKYYTPGTKEKLVFSERKVKQSGPFDFPKHVDTENIRFAEYIPSGAKFFITEKLHGTSHRVGMVRRRFKNKLLNAIFARFPFLNRPKLVHGTRNMVLSSGDHIGFHGKERFRFDVVGKPKLIEDEILYGEIVGYANGKPIMAPHDTKEYREVRSLYGPQIIYHYGEDNTCAFYVYRITRKKNGVWYDVPYEDMIMRCEQLGLKTPPLLSFGIVESKEQLLEHARNIADGSQGFFESKLARHPAEGVVVRIDHEGKSWYYKYKSFAFLVMEGVRTREDQFVDAEDVA